MSLCPFLEKAPLARQVVGSLLALRDTRHLRQKGLTCPAERSSSTQAFQICDSIQASCRFLYLPAIYLPRQEGVPDTSEPSPPRPTDFISWVQTKGESQMCNRDEAGAPLHAFVGKAGEGAKRI